MCIGWYSSTFECFILLWIWRIPSLIAAPRSDTKLLLDPFCSKKYKVRFWQWGLYLKARCHRDTDWLDEINTISYLGNWKKRKKMFAFVGGCTTRNSSKALILRWITIDVVPSKAITLPSQIELQDLWSTANYYIIYKYKWVGFIRSAYDLVWMQGEFSVYEQRLKQLFPRIISFEPISSTSSTNSFHELSMTSVSIDVIGEFWRATKRELVWIVKIKRLKQTCYGFIHWTWSNRNTYTCCIDTS